MEVDGGVLYENLFPVVWSFVEWFHDKYQSWIAFSQL